MYLYKQWLYGCYSSMYNFSLNSIGTCILNATHITCTKNGLDILHHSSKWKVACPTSFLLPVVSSSYQSLPISGSKALLLSWKWGIFSTGQDWRKFGNGVHVWEARTVGRKQSIVDIDYRTAPSDRSWGYLQRTYFLLQPKWCLQVIGTKLLQTCSMSALHFILISHFTAHISDIPLLSMGWNLTCSYTEFVDWHNWLCLDSPWSWVRNCPSPIHQLDQTVPVWDISPWTS